jgi:hypothetical protein
MKSLFLEKPGALAWHNTDKLMPASGEALMHVRRCGGCGTDTRQCRAQWGVSVLTKLRPRLCYCERERCWGDHQIVRYWQTGCLFNGHSPSFN